MADELSCSPRAETAADAASVASAASSVISVSALPECFAPDSSVPALPAPVFRFAEVPSALDSAHELIRASALPDWGSVLAERQTAGRGQLRRHWHSPAGNAYAALRLPAVPPFTGSAAAPAVGALMALALRRMGVPAGLKWPNDLVWEEAGRVWKFGGILLEERAGAVVAGIGVNVQWAPPAEEMRRDAAIPATHLAHIVQKITFSGELLRAETLWYLLVSQMFSAYNGFQSYASLWKEAAESCLLWKGRNVVLDDAGAMVCGTLLGLGDCGGLRLSVRAGEFLSGSLRLAAGTGRP